MTDLTYDKLKAKFPNAVLGKSVFRDEMTITIDAAQLVSVATFLRDEPELQYDLLMDVYGVDRRDLGESPRFVSSYELYSVAHNQRVRLDVPLADVPANGNNALPKVDSVTGVWPTANWLERETYDLMGIEYVGHPWLHRIMMPHNWVGHPLRKDYAIGGEPVYFTADRDKPEFAHLGKQIMDVPLFHSELEDMNPSDHMVVNMGPQHPATHGVLRLAAELDGERIVSVKPELGYLHSGFEKTGESKRYEQFIPYCDRLDYVSTMNNNLAYVLTVEKLLGVEVPKHAQYARVVLSELQRIASHMVWLGTHAMDVSGTIHALLMYAFYWREQILDIFEMVCGARMTTSYFSVGGLRWPLPGAFEDSVKHFLANFPAVMKDFHAMLTDNPIWKARLEGVGMLSAEQAIGLGVTGPLLRAAGVPLDLRKVAPYSSYEEFDFDVPTDTRADSYARYVVRMKEIEQSMRIIEQGLVKLSEGGLYRTEDRKVALPPREELDTSMEALIHHFKLVTEGYKPPVGRVYGMAENPKGILGFGIISDGSAHPYRLRVRGPSFVNLQATDVMARGRLLSDIVTIVGSIDIVLGEVDR